MSVTVRARLPKGDTNGLAHLEERLAVEVDQTLVVVGLLQTDTIEARPHDDDNPRLVKCVLLHVEALDEADAEHADKLLRAVYERRTGKAELPFETEAE